MKDPKRRGKVSVFYIANQLPYAMGQKLKQKVWGPITLEKVQEWWGILYKEWEEKNGKRQPPE